MKTGIELIAEERARQVSIEGWTPEHDDTHMRGELAAAGACYATMAQLIEIGKWDFEECSEIAKRRWQWGDEWWKPARSAKRNLEKAGALLAAELDRILREEAAGLRSPNQ